MHLAVSLYRYTSCVGNVIVQFTLASLQVSYSYTSVVTASWHHAFQQKTVPGAAFAYDNSLLSVGHSSPSWLSPGLAQD